MKKNFFLLLSTIVWSFFSCSSTDEITDGLSKDIIITAAAEDGSWDTRANFVKNKGIFFWTNDDQIAVYNTSNKFTTFAISTGQGTEKASFVGSMTGESTNCAVFPAKAAKNVSGSNLTIKLQSTYGYNYANEGYATYTTARFNSANTPMVAKIAMNGQLDFSFKHLAGAFCFQFTDIPANTYKFVFEAKKQKIVGDFKVDLSAATPTINTSEAIFDDERIVTIQFKPSSTTTSRSFYIPVPCGDYEGFQIRMYDTDETLTAFVDNDAVRTVSRRSFLYFPAIKCTTVNGSDESTSTSATHYTVRLCLSGEYKEEFTTRADNIKTYYAIQAYSMKANDSKDYYKEYAYGLFDNIDDIAIDLVSGYQYKFKCSIVKESGNQFYYTDDGKLMHPFTTLYFKEPAHYDEYSLSDLNRFILSPYTSFYNMNYGTTHIKKGSSYTILDSPSMDRFYGELLHFLPSEDGVATIPMVRAAFDFKVTVNGVPNGTLQFSVCRKGKSSGYEEIFSGLNTTTSLKSMTFYYPTACWDDTGIGKAYTEDFEIIYVWKKANGEKQEFKEAFTAERNKTSVFNITLVDDTNQEEPDEDTNTEPTLQEKLLGLWQIYRIYRPSQGYMEELDRYYENSDDGFWYLQFKEDGTALIWTRDHANNKLAYSQKNLYTISDNNMHMIWSGETTDGTFAISGDELEYHLTWNEEKFSEVYYFKKASEINDSLKK